MFLLKILVSGLFGIALASGPAAARSYQRIEDAASPFDTRHTRLSLWFDEAGIAAHRFRGRVELSLSPATGPLRRLRLGSSGLIIQAVRLTSPTARDLSFSLQGEVLLIELDRTYEPGQEIALAIDYSSAKTVDRGIYFKSRTGHAGVEVIYTHSFPDLSKTWFPGNPEPNDHSTYEAILEVPPGYTALSNGELVSRTAGSGSTIYRYLESRPIVSYLFNVTIGRFAEVSGSWRDVPLHAYGPPDESEALRYSFRNTGDLLSFIADRVGVAFPFEKYDQAVVPQYPYYGMEHASDTTLMDEVLRGPEQESEFSSDWLVVHEMAHQWFGDLVTCRNWDEIWLNEGFATYFDILNRERTGGSDAMHEELDADSAWYRGVEDKDPRPVVFPYYREKLEELFDAHAYEKGALVLHQIRSRMGDRAFFAALHRYLSAHGGRSVTTADFRQALEQETGQDWSEFFTQWLYRPGYPKFAVRVAYSRAAGGLTLRIEQRQDRTPHGVAGRIPYFAGPIGIEIDGRRWNVQLKAVRDQTAWIPLTAEPGYVGFNSGAEWIAEIEEEQPLSSWAAQLGLSPDTTLRVAAARALGQTVSRTRLAASALEGCALRDASVWVRKNCIEELAGLGSESAREAIESAAAYATSDPRWEIRASAMKLLGALSDASSQSKLISFLSKDASLKVRSAAGEALAAMPGSTAWTALKDALGEATFQDTLRQAILDALAEAPRSEAFEWGIEYSRPEYRELTRISALNLVSAIGAKDPGKYAAEAERVLKAAIEDPAERIRSAASDGLSDLLGATRR